MPGLINYLGLFIALGITAILIGGTIKYVLGDEKYRKKHRRDLIRALVEGTIFIIIGILVYLFGD